MATRANSGPLQRLVERRGLGAGSSIDLNNAEEVAVGILEHDEVVVRAISPRVASRSNRDQPLDFLFSVVRVQVQV